MDIAKNVINNISSSITASVMGFGKRTAMSKEERKRRNLESCRRYRESHPDRRKVSVQKWIDSNPDKVKANRDKHNAMRTLEDFRKVSQRTISFKGRAVILNYKPRTGVCSNCGRSVATGEIKQTQMHHDEYDPEHPDRHTRELCVRCHRRYHIELRRSNNHNN